MLRDFVEKKHYKFAREAKDWEDAVRMSCECLEEDGTVEENYKEEIIACIKKNTALISSFYRTLQCLIPRRGQKACIRLRSPS